VLRTSSAHKLVDLYEALALVVLDNALDQLVLRGHHVLQHQRVQLEWRMVHVGQLRRAAEKPASAVRNAQARAPCGCYQIDQRIAAQ
jgi:hypothetical protein